jgi:hypothetical protein
MKTTRNRVVSQSQHLHSQGEVTLLQVAKRKMILTAEGHYVHTQQITKN